MYVDRHAANKWESNTVIGHFQERLAKKTGEKIQTYLSIYVYEICMYIYTDRFFVSDPVNF